MLTGVRITISHLHITNFSEDNCLCGPLKVTHMYNKTSQDNWCSDR